MRIFKNSILRFACSQTSITDHPTPAVLQNIQLNVENNIAASERTNIEVQGHLWGSLDDSWSQANAHTFQHIIVADCLWMPHEHLNLARSIEHFLSKADSDARAYVVSGFHTGRATKAGFFDLVGDVDLKIEKIWEEDVDGEQREWDRSREDDQIGRKRWLSIAILKRKS